MSTVSSGDGAQSGSPDEQGRLRDQAGRQRDTAAARRDDRSAHRDEDAEARDASAKQLGNRYLAADPPADSDVVRVVQAAHTDRAHSHVDRVSAANDRTDAAVDRQEALADRMAAARDRREACLDGLTGAYTRQAGLLEMNRDFARASRSGQLLIVAFIDVDRLKAINDTHGHAAGDRALITVARTLMTALRPYDLVIRYGGDEFVCVAESVDVHAARLRFSLIDERITAAAHGVTVTIGVARLRTGESCESVIARADADMYRQRSTR